MHVTVERSSDYQRTWRAVQPQSQSTAVHETQATTVPPLGWDAAESAGNHTDMDIRIDQDIHGRTGFVGDTLQMAPGGRAFCVWLSV